MIADADVVELYGLEDRIVKQAVYNSCDRFPKHFMFELKNELLDLKSQFVTLKVSDNNCKIPKVFTECSSQ